MADKYIEANDWVIKTAAMKRIFGFFGLLLTFQSKAANCQGDVVFYATPDLDILKDGVVGAISKPLLAAKELIGTSVFINNNPFIVETKRPFSIADLDSMEGKCSGYGAGVAFGYESISIEATNIFTCDISGVTASMSFPWKSSQDGKFNVHWNSVRGGKKKD